MIFKMSSMGKKKTSLIMIFKMSMGKVNGSVIFNQVGNRFCEVSEDRIRYLWQNECRAEVF